MSNKIYVHITPSNITYNTSIQRLIYKQGFLFTMGFYIIYIPKIHICYTG